MSYKQLTENDNRDNITQNTVFVYGTLVDDLNVLDKNSIYSVSVGALQEVDRKQQEQQVQLDAQKRELETQNSELETQKRELVAAKQRIVELENRMDTLTALVQSTLHL